MRGKNVILIGMPGVGKSTVGKRLAAISGLQFLDTDTCIEKETQKKLSLLLAEQGIDRFIQIENDVCAALSVQGYIIATGGSVVYGKEAMQHLSSIGTVVYLKLSYAALRRRLGDLAARGVVLQPGQSLLDLYLERTPLYEKYADITIDESMCYPSQTTMRVYRALRSSGFFKGLGYLKPKKSRTASFVQPHPTIKKT